MIEMNILRNISRKLLVGRYSIRQYISQKPMRKELSLPNNVVVVVYGWRQGPLLSPSPRKQPADKYHFNKTQRLVQCLTKNALFNVLIQIF